MREQDKTQPWVAKLVKVYQSEEIRKFVQTEFKGAVVIGVEVIFSPIGNIDG